MPGQWKEGAPSAPTVCKSLSVLSSVGQMLEQCEAGAPSAPVYSDAVLGLWQ